MSIIVPCEDLWDMSFNGISTTSRAPHVVGNILSGSLFVICKTCYRYRVDNLQNMRVFDGVSGVLVMANHTSFLDVVFLFLSGRPSQWIRFMARDTLFEKAHGLLGFFIARVGAFPVKRDSADRGAVKRAVRMLKDAEVVGIFPEGTRRGKSDTTPEIHSGVALIARMAHVPILPATVREAEHIKERGKCLRFPKVSVDYGDPVLVSDFDFLPKKDRLDGCAWYAMRECFALSQKVAPEEVDMRALFPNGRDFSEVFAAHPVPKHSAAELACAIEAETRGRAQARSAEKLQASPIQRRAHEGCNS